MVIFRTGYGVGDVLMATGVLRAFRRTYPQQVIVETRYPELFRDNPDAWLIWRDGTVSNAIQNTFRHRIIWRLGNYLTKTYDQTRITPRYPFPGKGIHIMDAMAKTIGITLLPEERHPFLFLSKQEIKLHEWANNWIAVQSSSSTYWTPNKNWVPGRMQKVVDHLASQGYSVVQIGSLEDEPLNNVTDLRGKTTLREGAAILANSIIFIGLEGGLVHSARSVNCPAVVIYTGYTLPEETGYPENINIRAKTAGESCWSREPCEHCERSAQDVSVEEVLSAVLGILQKS